jgi:hypothetical protein
MTYLAHGTDGVWRVDAIFSVSHQGDPNETDSSDFDNFSGWIPQIWVTRDKHSNYAYWGDCRASIVRCNAGDPGGPHGYVFLNVGEPNGRLSDNVGDLLLKGGADPNYFQTHAWTQSDLDYFNAFYQMVVGHTIWRYEQFFGAGSITGGITFGDVWDWTRALLYWRPPYGVPDREY